MTPSDTAAEAERLETLLAQERDIQFDSFGYADAWAVGSRVVELATRRGLSVASSLVFGDQQVFHSALEGTSADNDDWLAKKFRVVRRYNHASLTIGTRFRARGLDFRVDSGLDPRLYAASGGAFPIRVRGSIVGILGVSGLTEFEDHDLAIEVLSEHAARQAPARVDDLVRSSDVSMESSGGRPPRRRQGRAIPNSGTRRTVARRGLGDPR
jgi:uncharacterized protein (UPF0303 family)